MRKNVLLGIAAAGAAFAALAPQPASAQADPLLGQVTLFANNFCPRGWMPAEGQLLSIAQNTALFSLLGTTYGGDGRTTFALPDLRDRAPVHRTGATAEGAARDAPRKPATGKGGFLVMRYCIAIQGIFPTRN